MRHKSPLVVKIGSAVLSDGAGGLDKAVFRSIVEDVAALVAGGRRVAIVTSGAIISGTGIMGLKTRPAAMQKKQALAAIGQVRLMSLYSELFAKKKLPVAQILLTHEDVAHRESFVNIRRTMNELFCMGVIPIVNENDTVSTREIKFGENDMLAVVVANILEAGEVIFLSAAPGLVDLDHGSRLIPRVERMDEGVFSLARGGNSLGSGGMGSKLMAIEQLVAAGKTAYLASGKEKGIIRSLLAGEGKGTTFVGSKEKVSSKRQWMIHHLKPQGRIMVDNGARDALIGNKASLLAPGVLSAEGHFKAGQLISICHKKIEFARGLSRLDSPTLERIKGLSKDECSRLMGPEGPGLVVHRNDIVFTEKEDSGGT